MFTNAALLCLLKSYFSRNLLFFNYKETSGMCYSIEEKNLTKKNLFSFTLSNGVDD
jgi:hypothetical protein